MLHGEVDNDSAWLRRRYKYQPSSFSSSIVAYVTASCKVYLLDTVRTSVLSKTQKGSVETPKEKAPGYAVARSEEVVLIPLLGVLGSPSINYRE